MFEPPNLNEEKKLIAQGYKLVAGIDEAGRGSLAGPVVAAAVVLSDNKDLSQLNSVRDSKEISSKKRNFLYGVIREEAEAFGIGIVGPEIIDSINILKATMLAMRKAVDQLPFLPHFLLIDGNRTPQITIMNKGIVNGDKLCLSIACASIIAKVTRDYIMVELDKYYPGYRLAKNKGYGTMGHLSCLEKLGPSPIHRYSFAPVKRNVTLI